MDTNTPDATRPEAHVLAEPPTDDAFYRAQALVLNRLSAWLCDEREKVEPSSERWRTLADVTEAIHQITKLEIHPAPPDDKRESAQPCGCDPGAKWVCERHRDLDGDRDG